MKTPTTEKKCSKCGEVKSADEFNKDAGSKDGKQNRCKACEKAWRQANKEWFAQYYQANKEKICEREKARYQANKEEISEQKKVYRQANKEEISEQKKVYRQANKEKAKAYRAQPHVKERRNKRQRERYENDPQFKAACILRGMLRRVRNGEAKTESALELVGCTTEELWEHLENSFVDGMTVQNHGEVWHIGHIEPLSGFDPTKDEHVKRVNHFSNLKAQFKEENMSDGAKVPDNHQAGLPLRYD
jgi:hypothetical protein